jgi:hypothetical protein
MQLVLWTSYVGGTALCPDHIPMLVKKLLPPVT